MPVVHRLCAPNDKPPYLCILMAPASRYIFHSFPIEETEADKAFMHVLEGIVMAVVTEGMGMIDEVRSCSPLRGLPRDTVHLPRDTVQYACEKLCPHDLPHVTLRKIAHPLVRLSKLGYSTPTKVRPVQSVVVKISSTAFRKRGVWSWNRIVHGAD